MRLHMCYVISCGAMNRELCRKKSSIIKIDDDSASWITILDNDEEHQCEKQHMHVSMTHTV